MSVALTMMIISPDFGKGVSINRQFDLPSQRVMGYLRPSSQ